MDALPAVRVCAGTNRDGSPCRSTLTGDAGFCRQHDPETAEIAKADSARGAQTRARPITEGLAQFVAENPDAVVKPFREALEATKTYVSAGEVVTVPDFPTRMRAAELIGDRLEGKAAQRTEITGANGGPLEFLALLKASSIADSF